MSPDLLKLAKIIPAPVLSRVTQMTIPLDHSDSDSHDISSALEKTTLLGGKRLRPLLLFLMGDLLGLSHEQLLPYAQTAEMVHAATLAHDDVIDEASLRRGHPTLPVITASNKRAILAGDLLLAQSLDLLTRTTPFSLPIYQELTHTLKLLVRGEWIQVDQQIPQMTRERVELQSLCKTASLLSWTLLVPCYLKELDPTTIEEVRRLGQEIGLIFQYTDDLLDFAAYSEYREKERYADVKNHIVNLPLHLLFTRMPHLNFESVTTITSETQNEILALTRAIINEHIAKAHQQIQLLQTGALWTPAQAQIFFQLVDLIASRRH